MVAVQLTARGLLCPYLATFEERLAFIDISWRVDGRPAPKDNPKGHVMSKSTTYRKGSRIGSVYNVFTKTRKAELTTAEIAKKVGMEEAEARAKARHIAKFNGHLVKIDQVTFRLATDDERANFVEHVPVSRVAKKSKPAVDEMNRMTVKDLRSLASGFGVTGTRVMKKVELVDAIKQAS